MVVLYAQLNTTAAASEHRQIKVAETTAATSERDVTVQEKYPLSTIQEVVRQVLVKLNTLKQKKLVLGNLTFESLIPDINRQISHDFSKSFSVKSIPNDFTQPLPYMAPEVVMKARPYTSDIDMWSLGCILYRMFSGELLFMAKDASTLMDMQFKVLGKYPSNFHKKTVSLDNLGERNLFEQKLLKMPLSESHLLKSIFIDFLMQMLEYRPHDRITPPLALNHPFVSGGYTIQSRVGSGSYSSVYSAVQRTRTVALKKGDQYAWYINKLSLVKEARIIQHLNAAAVGKDRHIARLVANFWHLNSVNIALKFCSGNNLFSKITQGKFSLEKIQHIGKQLLAALSFLKEQNTMHADFKPENIMFRDDTCNSVEVVDFGLSLYIDDPLPHHTLTQRYYRSPEVNLKVRPYTPAIDMWAFGCILYEMFTSKTLFLGLDLTKLHIQVLGKHPPDFVARAKYHRKRDQIKLSTAIQITTLKKLILANNNTLKHDDAHLASFIDLLKKILVYDPKKRLTPKKAAEHRFFSIDFSDKVEREVK